MPLYFDINSKNPTDKPFVKDIDAIFQSIENILNIRFGERFFRPDFFIAIEDNLFDFVNEDTAFEVEDEIVKTISENERRVRIDNQLTQVTPNQQRQELDVTIAFRVVGFGDQIFQFNGALRP